ncbi:MAG: alpha/beta fold hydrolase, partial [Cyanobacteria bacterium J06600_6]
MNRLSFSYLLVLILSSVWGWRSPIVEAAEKISFRYGMVEFAVPVASLENFATTGEVDRYLDIYLDSATPKELAKLQELANYSLEVDRVTVYRFFNSALGQKILQNLGAIIQPSPTKAGLHALRSSLIRAAGEKEGLNLLNVVRNYPAQTIYINGKNGLKLANTFGKLQKRTKKAIAIIKQQADLSSMDELDLDFTQKLDLRQPGIFTSSKEVILFNDRRRQRSFSANFYRPQLQTQIPTVVISPGLGGDSRSFDYLAQHLVSYGFAVIVVNHPGSDRQKVDNFFKGIDRRIVEAQEFIDRPQDISYILDRLQQQEAANLAPRHRLNLRRVGIIGHSFGAYTALALAGGKINIQGLQRSCKQHRVANNSLNLSLLLQCLAVELPDTSKHNLSDSRIKATFVLNPMNSLLFGQKGLSKIKTPVAFISGGKDLVTPPLSEQIIP